jgi:serine/threonine-protein kinase
MNGPATPAAVWRAAFDEFERVVPLSPTDREQALRALADSKPTLYRHVLTMLQADSAAQSAGFLDGNAIDALHASDPDPQAASTSRAGTALGAYRLERTLGTGGMGEVWLASRDHGNYSQPVALKLLRHQVATPPMRERFLREGRFLAQLSHSNIARLLDSGTAPDGTLWLALEFVDGDRIDRWCDERRLTLAERLRLFLQVCTAVAHAHGRLVVHRDLKPANVLVTADGTAKLLDFGIGKLLESDTQPAELTALTRVDARVMTPEYAAPEQVLGATITTATDIHALGALLYTLLCGEQPFGGGAESPTQLARAVLETDPIPPSERISCTDVQIRATFAAQRSTDPAGLRRLLRGDLDDIVGKAMRKPPEQRYSSATALAEDIERHLRHEPVAARAGSRSYRVGRFIRRHRVSLAAATAATFALVLGLIAALWQADLARQEARKATAIKDFVVGIFERNSLSHPDGARARRTTAEELLAESAQEIRTGLGDAPEVRTELLGVMAQLYSSLDLQGDALPLLDDKLANERAQFGAHSLPVAKTLTALAYSQIQVGDWTKAQASAREAAGMFELLGERSQLEYAQTYCHLAQTAMRLGKTQDGGARRDYLKALQIIETHHPRSTWRVEALHGLSRLGMYSQQYQESLEFAERAQRLIETGAVDVDGMTRGGSHQRIGNALHWLNRTDEAESHLRAAIVEYEKAGGTDHSFTIDGKRELGGLLMWIGKRAEAESLLTEALAAQERIKGPDDPELTAYVRYDLANALLRRGKLAAAEPHFLRAARAWQSSQAGGVVSPALGQVVRIQIEQGRLDEAAGLLSGLEQQSIDAFGKGSWFHGAMVVREGLLHAAQRKDRAARADFERAWRDWREPDDELQANRADAALGLAELELGAGDTEAALRRLTSLVAAIERSKARSQLPDQEASAHMLLGWALVQSNANAAVSHLSQAVAQRAQLYDAESIWLAEARLHLAQALWRIGERTAARAALAAAERAFAPPVRVAARYQRLLESTRDLLHR